MIKMIRRTTWTTPEIREMPEPGHDELVLSPEELLREHGIRGYDRPSPPLSPAERIGDAILSLGEIRKVLYDEPAQAVLERLKNSEGDSTMGIAHAYAEGFGIIDARLAHAKTLMDSLWAHLVAMEVALCPPAQDQEDDQWASR